MMNEKIVDEIFELTKELAKLKADFKDKLPFHLNVIDELRASENAHSRIFMKVLEYKDGDSYPFLKSFLANVGIKAEITNPNISVEKSRIDGLILDKDYTVIIENKINYAPDQNEQIQRYVKVVTKEKYSYDLNKVHVIYLTRWGMKKVEEYSLPNALREALGGRFYECSFRHNILAWLEDEVLPYCRLSETVLISAVQQYIDHLKGMFFLRKDLSHMDAEIKKYIKEKLELNGTQVENLDKIDSKILEVQEYLGVLNSFVIQTRDKLRADFLTKLFNKLNNYDSEKWKPVSKVFNDASIESDINAKYFGFRNIEKGLLLEYNSNKKVRLSIEIQEQKRFICGFFIHTNQELGENLIKLFADKEIKMIKVGWWIYLDLEEYDYRSEKMAWHVYDDHWNGLYVENTDAIVDVFHLQVEKVYQAWKEICVEAKKKELISLQ